MAASSTIVVATPVPVRQNLTWYLHSTWLLMLEIIGAQGQLLPRQVSDVQLRIASATAVVADLSLGNGISCPDPEGAYALVQIDPTAQAGFALGVYRYEARSVTPAGEVFAIQYGAITVGPSLFEEFLEPDPSNDAPVPIPLL